VERRTSDPTPVSPPPIPQEEAAKHSDAVHAFQELRNRCADVSAGNEGARAALTAYSVHLAHAEAKFPVSEAGVKIPFSWSDTLLPASSGTVSQFSWTYERACVLFNLAAVESVMAVQVDRKDAPSMEAACALFSSAASALTHVRDAYAVLLVGAVPLDLTAGGLDMLITLMLAQAQAIYYEIARAKDMRPETISKLAAGTADLYRTAAAALPNEDARIRNPRDAVEDYYPWITHCAQWAMVFDAAAFFQQSVKVFAEAEVEGKGYGVRLTWLRAAESASKAADALRTAACTPGNGRTGRSKAAAAAAAALSSPSQAQLAAIREKLLGPAGAEDLNNSVYREYIPRAAELPNGGELPRAVLAKLKLPYKEPSLATTEPPSRPIFGEIVSAEVARSLVVLDEKLRGMAEAAKVRAGSASVEARARLAELGLPAAAAVGAGAAVGLPPAVWERVHACQRQGGMVELDRLLAGNRLRQVEVRDALQAAKQTLDDEASRDGACRAQYGHYWVSLPSSVVSADLRAEITKYEKLLDVARTSEDTVAGKVESHRSDIAALGCTRSELDALIPPGTGIVDTTAETLRAELASLCAALEGLIAARATLPGAIPSRMDRFAAASALSALPAAEHAGLLDRIASGPNSAVAALEEGYAQQAKLLEAVHATAARFAEARTLDERTRARETAIQSVGTAADRFEEVRSNVKDGEVFWTELKSRAEALGVKARDMATARALQQRELLMQMQAQTWSAQTTPSGAGGGFAPGGAAAGGAFNMGPLHVALPPMRSEGGGQHASGSWSPFGSAPSAPSPSHQAPPGAWQPAFMQGPPQGYAPVSAGPPAGHGSSRPVLERLISMGYPPEAAAKAAQMHGADFEGALNQLQYGSPIPTAQAVPTSSAFDRLVGMGFPPQAAAAALQAHGGEFDGALNQLLAGAV
jgi:programmed cell death 6-interacting protein